MPSLQSILETVSRDLPATGVDFLLIGGFAVNYYGYTRNTLDVDFMIAEADQPAAKKIMSAAGFSTQTVLDNVTFFHHPEGGMRIDFLTVDAASFARLYEKARTIALGGIQLRVPDLLDLLAMKLFAIHHGGARRQGKDLPDVAYLCVLNDVDLENDLRPLCERFASETLFREVCKQVVELIGKQ